jgi:uncharacterized protein (DUF488 family)
MIYYGCTARGYTARRRAIMMIYTIGHSHIPMARFTELLMLHRVETLIDARSQPHSRFAPQFNRKALHLSLEQAGIAYRYLGDKLGGRPKDPQYRLPHGKIDYRRLAQAPLYREGLQELRREAAQSRVAVLCAEADFRQCHRYWLITRSLVGEGVGIQHILHAGALVATTPDEFVSPPEQWPLF